MLLERTTWSEQLPKNKTVYRKPLDPKPVKANIDTVRSGWPGLGSLLAAPARQCLRACILIGL